MAKKSPQDDEIDGKDAPDPALAAAAAAKAAHENAKSNPPPAAVQRPIPAEPTRAAGALAHDSDHTHQPTQAELDRDKKPLDKVEAEQLLRAGHRLRIKGASPLNWVAMTRHADQMAISYNATPEAVEKLLNSGDLINADS
jgi:hypothetical protein